MSRADDLTKAQREVDAMLPDTPPIAPPLCRGCGEEVHTLTGTCVTCVTCGKDLANHKGGRSCPLALPGCIEIPADAPFLRARFGWDYVGFILSALLAIVCFVRTVIAFESRMQDAADLHAKIERVRERMMEIDADIRILREATYDLEVRTDRARGQLERIAHEKRGRR